MDIETLVEKGLCHEIHTSQIRSFRGCRRRWNWVAREHYYPVTTPKPIQFGVAYHKALEAYYDPLTYAVHKDTRAALAVAYFVKECETQRLKYMQAEGIQQLGLEADVQADFDERENLGKRMLNYFFLEVAPTLGLEPIQVEIPFRVPIVHPDNGTQLWCACKECVEKGGGALPVVYAGRCDALVKDMEGHLYILDWKTTSRFMEDQDYWLLLDDQIASYPAALRYRLGIDVKGFIYVEMKKAAPEPPKQNKTLRQGRKFSVDKTMATTYDLYLQTIMAEDPSAHAAGLYDDYLAYLQGLSNPFVRVHKIHKTDRELAEVFKIIGAQALDMLDSHLRLYPSPGRFTCQWCAYKVPCVGMFRGEDVDYILKHSGLFEQKPHYFIREQPSTESKGAE